VKTKAVRGLSKPEAALVVQTKRSELTGLDEDALLDLHRLVRKKRNKYVKLDRRESQQRVKDHGTRDQSLASDSGVPDRAELFEDRLAVVSRQLAVVSRRSADRLRAERLDQARGRDGSGPRRASAARTDGVARRRDRSGHDRRIANAGRKKREASSAARGAARQKKRDSKSS
jgi:hypothetical protein